MSIKKTLLVLLVILVGAAAVNAQTAHEAVSGGWGWKWRT